MKRILRIFALAAAMLLLACPMASAAGGVSIAIQGQNGFDEYISSMFVFDGRLLMCSWDTMYTWKPGDEGITPVEGYESLTEDLDSQRMEAAGEACTIVLGDAEIELDEGEHISLSSTILPAGDTLYRQAAVYGEDGETRSLLVEVRIGEDGSIALGDVVDLDDALIIDYGGGYSGSRDITNPCYYDGVLYCLSYGESGRELLAIDLENAEADPLTLDTEGYVQSISPFTEGKLLLVELNTSADPMVTSLLCYDIDSEEMVNLGQLPNQNWETPAAIAYDEARGMIYYTLSGSVWRMRVAEEGLGEPEEFGDMPLEIYSDANAVLLGNYYILSSYEGVVGRDVDVEALPEQRLRVENLAYDDAIKSAYYDFTDAHGEVMVSISNSGSTDSILQDMMNRSSDTDIYTLSAASDAYQALLERGYMAELGGSGAICEAVGAMYETVQAAVSKDGEIYALPLQLFASTLSINRALFTGKLGYAEEELPDNWPDFFALLADLGASGKLEEYPEVSVLGPGHSQRDIRYMLFGQMAEDYFLWLDQSEENLLRGNEVLLAACEAFEAVDWTALGLPEEFDYEDDSAWYYDGENVLLGSNSISPQYYYEETQEPLVLAVAQGEEQLLGFEMAVALVNPFSTQREAAIAYLETALACMRQEMKITLMPGENDPIENSYYEEGIRNYDESIADIEERLADETLTDEQLREELMQNLEDMKSYREEYMERSKWEVSPEAIARYRTYAQQGVVARASLWESGTYSTVYQYLDGAISAQQLCQELEKTLQMQRLEGM